MQFKLSSKNITLIEPAAFEVSQSHSSRWFG